MSRAAKSIFAFGAYLAGGGVALVLVPDWVCALLRLSPPSGAWIRITGMFFLLFANYCVRAALKEETTFIRWTVATRPTTLIFLGAFVAGGLIEPIILVFGVVDVFASLWTHFALKADDRDRPLSAATGGE